MSLAVSTTFIDTVRAELSRYAPGETVAPRAIADRTGLTYMTAYSAMRALVRAGALERNVDQGSYHIPQRPAVTNVTNYVVAPPAPEPQSAELDALRAEVARLSDSLAAALLDIQVLKRAVTAAK